MGDGINSVRQPATRITSLTACGPHLPPRAVIIPAAVQLGCNGPEAAVALCLDGSNRWHHIGCERLGLGLNCFYREPFYPFRNL